MKNKIKESYDKVKISKNLEDKILDKTVRSEEVLRRFKFSYVLGVLVLIFGIFMVSVSAEDIESFFAQILLRGNVVTNDGNKYQLYKDLKGTKFNDVSDLTHDKEIISTIEDVENLLGIKLLKDSKVGNNEVRYTLMTDQEVNSLRKGKVDRVSIRYLDFNEKDYGYNEINGSNYGFNLYIRILSDKALEHTKIAYLDELNTMGGKELIEKYHSNNLDTDVIIYSYEEDNLGYEYMGAMFVYKDIRYEFTGSFEKDIPINDLKNIIECMHE